MRRFVTIMGFVAIALFFFGGETWAVRTIEKGYQFKSTNYHLMHMIQMMLIVALAWYIRGSVRHWRTRDEKNKSIWRDIALMSLMATGFALIGEFISTGLIDLSFIMKNNIVLSAIPMAGAIVLFTISMRTVALKNGWRPDATLMRFSMIVWPIMSCGAWAMVVDASTKLSLVIITLIFSFLVIAMAIMSLWMCISRGPRALPIAIGASLYTVSACLSGIYLSVDRELFHEQLIWATQTPALALLMLIPTLCFSEKADLAAQKEENMPAGVSPA